MKDAVICEPVRTPVGRYGGIFKDLPATELAETVLKELVRRTGIGAGDIDDVIFGQCYPNGEAPAIGRIAALDAGLGVTIPGLQIDRRAPWSLTGAELYQNSVLFYLPDSQAGINFITEVARGNRLYLRDDSGSDVQNYSLSGSSASIGALVDCGDVIIKRTPGNPFK